MAIKLDHYGIIIMILIMLFALTHVGVSIAILITDRYYGDIYQPEIGLAAFNITICSLGLLVSIFGLFALLTHRSVLGKLTAIISGVLCIFALASLVTSIVINANAATYVTQSYTNDMFRYRIDTSAREIVDRIQSEYQCCGRSISLDWAYMPFMSMNNRKKRDLMLFEQSEDMLVHQIYARETYFNQLQNSLITTSRNKRQSIAVDNSVVNISYATKFQVPTSCCISNQNQGTSNCSIIEQLNNKGCVRYIVRRANMQDLGIAIINSFMVVLALIAIPFLLHGCSTQADTNQNNNTVKVQPQSPILTNHYSAYQPQSPILTNHYSTYQPQSPIPTNYYSPYQPQPVNSYL